MRKKHGSACLHSALTRRGTELYKATGKNNNTKTLNMRYSEYGKIERGLKSRLKGQSSISNIVFVYKDDLV